MSLIHSLVWFELFHFDVTCWPFIPFAALTFQLLEGLKLQTTCHSFPRLTAEQKTGLSAARDRSFPFARGEP